MINMQQVLGALFAMAASVGVVEPSLPAPRPHRTQPKAERIAALSAAEAKRARKAAKRLTNLSV